MISVVQVLEASHGTKVCTLEGHSKAVLSISVHRTMIATTSDDCTCCLFPPIKKAKTSKMYVSRLGRDLNSCMMFMNRLFLPFEFLCHCVLIMMTAKCKQEHDFSK